MGCDHHSLESLFDSLWHVYSDLNPSVKKIKAMFEAEGERVINDHVAFRTLAVEPFGIGSVSNIFEALGYRAAGTYDFPKKNLVAKHFESAVVGWPKVFISELVVTALSVEAQSILGDLVAKFDPESLGDSRFCYSGRQWPAPSYADYEKLRKESEYAAWFAVFGHVPNHFTVRVNELQRFSDLKAVNDFIEAAGYRLNDAGGKVKGGINVCLEQSSTMAEQVEVQFLDGAHSVPSVFYEFAFRFPKKDGRLFEGFVTENADKIFESTDKK